MRMSLCVLALLAGCDAVFQLTPNDKNTPPVVACTSDEVCTERGQGTCTCGACSYSEPACPITNLRWATGASGELSAACVPAIDHVDARVYYTCATMTDGTAWCWGWNADGQLGVAQPIGVDSFVPVRLRSSAGTIGGLVELRTSVGTTCGRTTDGMVSCWGSNQYGQLGAGLPTGVDMRAADPASVQTQAGALASVTSLTLGYFHACALVEVSGQPDAIYCWGSNSYGQLGDGTIGTVRETAVPVVGLPAGDIKAVSAGGEHTCAIVTRTGDTKPTAWCWGRTRDGRLGNGVMTDGSQPVPQAVHWTFDANPIPDVTQISTGNRFSCLIKNPPGELFCWGLNDHGALGNGTRAIAAVATRVTGPNADQSLIAADDLHTCGVASTNLSCWGSDANGEIGDGVDDGMDELVPVVVIPGQRQRDLTAAFRYTCALDGARRLWCWGANEHGGLGTGDPADQPAPRELPAAAFCPVTP